MQNTIVRLHLKQKISDLENDLTTNQKQLSDLYNWLYAAYPDVAQEYDQRKLAAAAEILKEGGD